MASFESGRKEQPSRYFVQDRGNAEELLRLTIQDRMLTAAMGGVLSEQADPGVFRRVLDVGCGTGGWAIETAQAYPNMSVFGADISRRMIDYAREQAAAAQITDRVEFSVMDALLILEFPTSFFDLVNLRLSSSFMLTGDWPKMLSELLRVTRPGGVVRLTEPEIIHQSNSPALTHLFEQLQCALFQAGHLFTDESTGISTHLARLLKEHGCQPVQEKVSTVEYRAAAYQAATAEGQAYYSDMLHLFRTVRPFIRRWGCLSAGYDVLYQQALDDMQQNTFHSIWNLHTAWGNKPNWWVPRKLEALTDPR